MVIKVITTINHSYCSYTHMNWNIRQGLRLHGRRHGHHGQAAGRSGGIQETAGARRSAVGAMKVKP